MDKIIGYIIESLRSKNNLTRNELAKKVSLPRQYIMKIETSKMMPTKEQIFKISNIFRFDIQMILDSRDVFSTNETYRYYVDFKLALYNFDLRVLEKLINEVSNNNDFTKGEPLQIVYHAKGLLSIHKDKNYEEAILICKKGIEVFYELDYEKLSNKRLTDYTYLLMLSLATSIEALGDINECKIISDTVLNNFRKFVFDIDDPDLDNKHMLQKGYVISINNAAHCTFVLKQYWDTLELLEEGITKCKMYEIHTVLTFFQHLKFECLYCLEKYEEAQQNYNILKTICTITGNGELLVGALKVIKEKYPKIST